MFFIPYFSVGNYVLNIINYLIEHISSMRKREWKKQLNIIHNVISNREGGEGGENSRSFILLSHTSFIIIITPSIIVPKQKKKNHAKPSPG